jgi:hypothetical protein
MTSYLTIKIKERSIAAPPDPIAPSEIGYEFDILQPPRPYDTIRHTAHNQQPTLAQRCLVCGFVQGRHIPSRADRGVERR